MRKTGVVLGLAALLAGCGGTDEVREVQARASSDAADVAMVERMSKAPLVPIVPQPLSATDRVRFGLDRSACRFTKSGEAEAIFHAGPETAHLQVDGKLQRLAGRSESAELPGKARSAYVGLADWVDIQRLPDEGGESEGDKGGTQLRYPARMTIHDAQERVAFIADGRMDCTFSQ